jgi:AcrR family transcriptional regulator
MPTQHERRADAEAKLMASARELIAHQGASCTSLAQIGKRAGYSRGIVNHHFGTKDELVKRLVATSQDAFADRMSPELQGTGLDAILSIVDGYMQGLHRSDPADRSFLVMWAEAAGAQPELRDAFVDGDRRFRSAVRAYVGRGIRDGSIRADVRPDTFAAGLVAQLRGLGVGLLVDPSGFEIERVRHTVLDLTAAGLTKESDE